MLGYTNQFLTHDLESEWAFTPFWSPIFMVWHSECVTRVRRTRSAAEWHAYALEIQQTMEALRASDAAEDGGEAEAARYWDGRNSEGVSDYVARLVGGATGVERAWIRAEYDGVRALLALWEAQREQGNADEPSIEAALFLFQAVLTAQDGDGILESQRRRELEALRNLDQARFDFDVYLERQRSEFEKLDFIPRRENPTVVARLKELESAQQEAIEKAQKAILEERRQRSSKGGAAQAKFYADARERLIEQYKATFVEFPSIAAAASALGRTHGFSERTAEEHLRRYVAENPEFRPRRRRPAST